MAIINHRPVRRLVQVVFVLVQVRVRRMVRRVRPVAVRVTVVAVERVRRVGRVSIRLRRVTIAAVHKTTLIIRPGTTPAPTERVHVDAPLLRQVLRRPANSNGRFMMIVTNGINRLFLLNG